MIKGTLATIQSKAYGLPQILQAIPDPPRQLYVSSNHWSELLTMPAVAVVGSRKVSSYGQEVTTQLVRALARAGVCIISGLAYGVDALAHRAALEAGGRTIAVLAGGLDQIYPRRHLPLAADIVTQKGALVSEYPPGTAIYKMSFVARNRLVSGLSRGVLITEAAEKSGTLHTAAFALEQGREVFAVPGAITSPNAAGTNRLIQQGATVVTSADDILVQLGLDAQHRTVPQGDTPVEQIILDLIGSGVRQTNELLKQSQLEVAQFNQTLTMLEISGKVAAQGNNYWSVR